MKTRLLPLLAGVLAMLAACTDSPLPLDPVGSPQIPEALADDSVGAPPADGVGTFGEIQEIRPQGQGLVLYQTGLDFEPAPGVRKNNERHDLAVGARHQKLQVHIRDTTEIWVNGKLAPVDSLAVGMQVLVVGRVTGAALHADQILDLSDAGPPPEDWAVLAPYAEGPGPVVAGPAAGAPEVGIRETSLCMGQRLPYDQPNILEFQGCWGGPSASDFLNTGFIPIFCPLIGCFGFDQLRYTAALAGWGFAFPIQFDATPQGNLVYHVPGQVDLQLTPLTAGDAVSFWGGLGLEFGIRFRWCGIFGCYDLGTKWLSAFTTVQQSQGAAPLTGQVLDIATTSCPSVGIIPVEKFPLNPLSIGFCQDLDLEGAAFRTRVYVSGAEDPWRGQQFFGPSPVSTAVRPMAMNVGVRYDEFRWVPTLRQGLFFRFRSFSIRLFDTPTIPLGSGEWHAITTPFPLGFPFSVATDPLSPIDDLRYMYHPTQAWLGLDVDPAPTLLGITSATALPEGTPVTVWLREEYMAAPIVGAEIVLEATGLNGTPSTSLTAMTAGGGVAAFVLPPGEYALWAHYHGAETYVPSSASMAPVYVYRPTTFVIWGGNAGGIQTDGRYQYWGSGWVRQVTGGDWGGNASFQGFADPVSETEWVSPPASSAIMPADMADLISVIVTTKVTGRGSRSAGDIAGHMLLRVDSPERYRPNSGHAMWGVARAALP